MIGVDIDEESLSKCVKKVQGAHKQNSRFDDQFIYIFQGDVTENYA